MRYLVTKEIKSETQVIWKLYFQDFAFLLIWIMLNYRFKEIAHPYLRWPMFIFAVAMGILLVLPSVANPKRRQQHLDGKTEERRQYQSIMLYLMRSQETLYFIKKGKEAGNEEGQDQRFKRRYPKCKV